MPLPKTQEAPPRIQIQAIEPILDCGRFPVKCTVGEPVDVYATVFKDGHDVLDGAVRVRGPGQRGWSEEPLQPLGNDRWAGTFTVDAGTEFLELIVTPDPPQPQQHVREHRVPRRERVVVEIFRPSDKLLAVARREEEAAVLLVRE